MAGRGGEGIDREAGVIVRGISDSCTAGLLEAAFGGFGPIVDVFIKPPQRKNGRPGFAFVTFASRASVPGALAGAPATIGEDAVTVEARTPLVPRAQASASANIYIKGLREGTTEAQVLEAATGFGPVASVELVSNDTRPIGFAFVAFETVEAATAAVGSGDIIVAGFPHTVEFRLTKPRGAGKGRRRRRKAPAADNVDGVSDQMGSLAM